MIMYKLRKIAKNYLPPILLSFLKKYFSFGQNIVWKGNYSSWEDAKRVSTGYEAPEILENVRAPMLKVKKGEAVYERDSVLFDEIQYSWPLLAGLMYAAAKSGGVLKVCDFGGSLGSTYYQCKKFLDGLKEVIWCIVEQRHFVDIGKKEFEDDRLKFCYDIATCKREYNPNVLVLSSVLQYIEKPYDLLEELLKHNFEFVIIDRTPFNSENREVIKVQVVPPWIYKASYPCWFFDMGKMKGYLISKGYKIIEIFDALDGKSEKYEFKGFILEKEND